MRATRRRPRRPPRPRLPHRRRSGAGCRRPRKPSRGRPPRRVPAGNAVFPSAVDPKYAKESAGKGRMHTCVDQYNANKASNGNGGMKWIEKGGGYYSECNKQLKG